MSDNRHHAGNVPELIGDRYRVEHLVGEGASALTYRGHDERLDRPVAIKFLRQTIAADESFVRRFELEARAAASVAHGNVVDVYDFGQQDGWMYIVMQFVDGQDLKEVIKRDAPLSIRNVRSIIGQVLDGLQAIHAAGIIHRDIKPQNVLIGHDGRARLTDFGVARTESDVNMTSAGTTLGTSAYMSPEQAQGHRVTEATDLYAVGVMVYEMLTGYLPFNAPTAAAMMLEHIQNDAVPPSQRLPGRGINPPTDSVVMQALAKDPRRRFGSARAMKQAVGQALSGTTQSTSQETVVARGSASDQTRVAPVGWSAQPPPQSHPTAAQTWPGSESGQYSRDRAVPSGNEGNGMRRVMLALLTLLLVGVIGVGAMMALPELNIFSGSGDPTVTPSPPAATLEPGGVEQIEPTETAESDPTATDTPPTETPEPRATDTPPTQTPMPTSTPTPIPPTQTPVPTQPPPAPQPTDAPPIIEPLEITPFPTTAG